LGARSWGGWGSWGIFRSSNFRAGSRLLCLFLVFPKLRASSFQLLGCSRSLGSRVDLTDGGTDRHLGTFGDGDLEDAGFERGDLGGDLVGVECEEEFADGDVVAVFLMPGGEDAGGDGFADGRDEDGDAHVRMGWREVVGK
jgi:hypothetical protein